MKTFKEINLFDRAAGAWIRKDAKNAQTKLGYAIKKITDTELKDIFKDYQKQLSDLWHDNVGKKQLDLALTDKTTGEVLVADKDSERPYRYDKKSLSEIIEIERGFIKIQDEHYSNWENKEFDIKGHIISDIPEGLTDEELEAFKGFVIN